MKKFKNKYRIPSARCPKWDYGSNGSYFVTICTKNRVNYFGDIVDHKMQLSHIGVIADILWYEIKNHAKNVELDEFVVMPNHIHGIITLSQNTSIDTGTNPNDKPADAITITNNPNPDKTNIANVVGDDGIDGNREIGGNDGNIDNRGMVGNGGMVDNDGGDGDREIGGNDGNIDNHGMVGNGGMVDNDGIAGDDGDDDGDGDDGTGGIAGDDGTGWIAGDDGTGWIVETTHALSLRNQPIHQSPPIHPPTPAQQRFQNQGKNTLSSIVGSYKSAVTKHAHRLGYDFEWQSRFYDNIIRDNQSFERIKNYIINNPAKWNGDKFFSI